MPLLDSGTEALTPRLPAIFLIGLLLIPVEEALASNDLAVAMTPGIAVIEDHAQQISGRGDIAINSGNTLSASSEIISDVVIYWNPAVARMFVTVVDGAEALTSAGAEAPSDADVEDALPDSSYPWARAGRVKFARDSGSVITIEWIDHTVRPLGIDPDAKSATAEAAQERDVVDANRQLYEFSHYETITVDAADVANGDVLTNKPVPPFYGKIGAPRAVIVKAITTGGKSATLNLEIGTTNLTGGVINVTGANVLGTVVGSTNVTGNNTFTPGDTWSLEASAVTTFIEGRIMVEVPFYRLRTA